MKNFLWAAFDGLCFLGFFSALFVTCVLIVGV